jgi:hypothetical protein
MAEPSETPPGSINNHSNSLATIQPTTKLGGRGTPRRKTRRPNNTNHSASIAARTLENKLKPFRTQFQLQDQQELCDVTILYDDGHVDVQKQVHVHSTGSMTIHEIDSSETGIQSYHINDLDSTSLEYLFGNTNNLEIDMNNKQSISTINSSNYYTDLQQRQFYSQPSRYYMNYVAYQHNPYVLNSYDNYSNSIQQVYGGVNNTHSDDEHESIEKTSKRKRRRRKHAKTISEQSSSIIPQQEEEVLINQSIEHHPENENINTTKPKRKRRRIRKSKKSKTDLSSSLPPTQYVELEEQQPLMSTKYDIYTNGNAFMNVEKNEKNKKEIQPRECLTKTVDDITPTMNNRIPTVEVIDVDKTEDENEKIILPVIVNTSRTTKMTNNISPIIINKEIPDQHVLEEEQQQTMSSNSDHNQVNILYFT